MCSTSEPFHLLFVDDDPITLELATNALASTRHCITCTQNGEEVVGLIEMLGIDIVVLDLVMPNVDGFEVLKRMQASSLCDKVTIIAASVRTDEEMVNRALSSGAHHFFAKPIQWDAFASEVQKIRLAKWQASNAT